MLGEKAVVDVRDEQLKSMSVGMGGVARSNVLICGVVALLSKCREFARETPWGVMPPRVEVRVLGPAGSIVMSSESPLEDGGRVDVGDGFLESSEWRPVTPLASDFSSAFDDGDGDGDGDGDEAGAPWPLVVFCNMRRMKVWIRSSVETARQAMEIHRAGMRLMLLGGFCFHFLVASALKGVDPRRAISPMEQASTMEHLEAKSSRAASSVEEELKNMRVQPTSAMDSLLGGPFIEKRFPVDQCLR